MDPIGFVTSAQPGDNGAGGDEGVPRGSNIFIGVLRGAHGI